MIYKIQSLSENPVTNQPYQLEMPRHLESTHVPFHADMNKLIKFWKFDNTCLPSFIETNFNKPIASLNPNERGELPQTFQGLYIGEKYKTSNFKKINDELKSFLMPQVSYHNYEVEIFKVEFEQPKFWQRLFGKKNILKKSIIDKSNYKIGFTNGRHRTRYFEFIGAKDIWVAIPKNQLDWFKENCNYEQPL